MDAPDESLVKYDHPLFVAKKKDEKSDKVSLQSNGTKLYGKLTWYIIEDKTKRV